PTQILAGFRAAGVSILQPYWTSLIAETHAAAGRWEAALEGIEDCIRTAEATSELQFLPELLRLKGTFLVQRDAGDIDTAEACFRRSVDLARAQQSRMCEIRSLTSLGSLLRKSGRAQEVSGRLEQLCSEITEGAELRDLKEGRALLAELRAAASP